MSENNNQLTIDLEVLQTLEMKSMELYKEFIEQIEKIQQQANLVTMKECLES